MGDQRTMELKQALLAVIATAASMGIDVDVLCDSAGADLIDDEQADWVKPFAPGAIAEIDHCRKITKGFEFVDR